MSADDNDRPRSLRERYTQPTEHAAASYATGRRLHPDGAVDARRTKASFKIVMLGSTNVGKTCLVVRFCDETFSADTPNTVGAFFLTRNLDVGGVSVKTQIWDTAGQERFRSMAPMYYRGAAAAVLVCDLSDEASFAALQSWVDELREYGGGDGGRPMVLAVAANKADLPASARAVDPARVKVAAEDEWGALFFETSAKDNTGVDALFRAVARAVVEQRGLLADGDNKNGGKRDGPPDPFAPLAAEDAMSLQRRLVLTGPRDGGALSKKKKKCC